MEAHEPTPQGELVITPTTLTFEAYPETHSFVITNETNNAVSISTINMQPENSLLNLSYGTLPRTLQPNQSMEVEVELNAMGYKGYFTYTINIATSLGNRQVTVNVNEEAWDEGLILWPMQGLTFGPNSPTTQTFYLKNTNALQSITLNAVSESGSSHFTLVPSHDLPYNVQAGEMFAVTATLIDFPEQATTANVYVSCSDYTQTTPAYFTIEAFPPQPQGELIIMPETLWFNQMGESQNFVINNQTANAVTIQDIVPEAHFLNIEEITLPYTLEAGQTVTVTVWLLAGMVPLTVAWSGVKPVIDGEGCE